MQVSTYLRPFELQTLVAIYSESGQSLPKILHAAICCGFAVWLETGQMPISRAGHQFLFAALHKIWFWMQVCSYAVISQRPKN